MTFRSQGERFGCSKPLPLSARLSPVSSSLHTPVLLPGESWAPPSWTAGQQAQLSFHFTLLHPERTDTHSEVQFAETLEKISGLSDLHHGPPTGLGVSRLRCWKVLSGQLTENRVRVSEGVCVYACLCISTYACVSVCTRICMYLHVYTCACVYVCMCLCVYMCIRVPVSLYVYACLYVCMLVYMYVCVYMSMCVSMSLCVFMHMCVPVFVYVCMCLCVYISICMCICICVCICALCVCAGEKDLAILKGNQAPKCLYLVLISLVHLRV